MLIYSICHVCCRNACRRKKKKKSKTNKQTKNQIKFLMNFNFLIKSIVWRNIVALCIMQFKQNNIEADVVRTTQIYFLTHFVHTQKSMNLVSNENSSSIFPPTHHNQWIHDGTTTASFPAIALTRFNFLIYDIFFFFKLHAQHTERQLAHNPGISSRIIIVI